MHVAIVMGSDSDLSVMKKAVEILNQFEVTYDVALASAHRTPEKLIDFVETQEEKGVAVFMAGPGRAGALPGVVASLTTKPVIGVPLSGNTLDGMDALLSIVQMPSGMPVATVAIDGAKNAALLAVQMGALSDAVLCDQYKAYRNNMAKSIYEKDKTIQEKLKD